MASAAPNSTVRPLLTKNATAESLVRLPCVSYHLTSNLRLCTDLNSHQAYSPPDVVFLHLLCLSIYSIPSIPSKLLEATSVAQARST